MQIQTDDLRTKLERATSLHLIHWQVILGSLVLTLFAWHMAKKQVEERISKQFERESSQVIELVQERMQKYEDALWAGAALYDTLGGEVSNEEWYNYTHSITLEEKYPGINGIGVIHAIDPADIPAFNASQQGERPDFHVFPEHDRPIAYPITYIEPVDLNRKAVGLDIAHETNRYTAAEKARLSGKAQITGPIVLVQDSTKTPGFLFYAPFYERYGDEHDHNHADELQGLIYAPFVVKKLMEGALSLENRHVNLLLTDNGLPLYSELDEDNPDYDPDPQLERTAMLNIYGRDWSFKIESGLSFREAQGSNQPLIILFGGILIDVMIFSLFSLLARSNRQALHYADMANIELQSKNSELEQYVYTASHDLKSPLFSIQGFANLLREDLDAGEFKNLSEYADCIITGTERMRTNIEVLLELSRIGRSDEDFSLISCSSLISDIIDDLDDQIQLANATVRTHGSIPKVNADTVRLRQVFENLIVNAIKYASEETPLVLDIDYTNLGDRVRIDFTDNGPGVPEQYRERIFQLFQRLETDIQGTGVGLSIVKRVVEIHGGKVWIEDNPSGGARFSIELPMQTTYSNALAA